MQGEEGEASGARNLREEGRERLSGIGCVYVSVRVYVNAGCVDHWLDRAYVQKLNRISHKLRNI